MSTDPSGFQAELKQEIDRRRTFAIISHPDAGKTTLTEKLLLYGGAIQRAGMVTQKANRHQTVSDWMEMEQRRGISVTSTALQFDYNNICYNLLDTPGHQDFSEDTYRTLMAVDSAIMLLDAAKGVEPQTIKLFKVCRERGIPIFTIINKMDRPSLNPFELLDEVEKVLGILAVPMTWPIGEPGDFKGVYERPNRKVHLYERTSGGQWKAPVATAGLEDPHFAEMVDEHDRNLLDEELEMVEGLIHPFDVDLFHEGEMTPVFFACAINNFGLDNFLDHFTELAPSPGALKTVEGEVPPETEEFSGFVYKIQANMNKAHRDRVAFMRVATGKFQKNMSVKHLRSGKKVKLSFPYRLFGQKREIIEEAYPGDIVGLVNPGLFRSGDLLTAGKPYRIPSFPRFAPELFCRVHLADQTHNKSFRKGMEQLGEEGVVQVFYDPRSYSRTPVLAAVGELQLEVFKERMKEEYRCEVRFERLDYTASRWIVGDFDSPEAFTFTLMEDEAQRPVALFRNEWHMNQVIGNEQDLTFLPHPPDVEA
ncbi:peptide chain release factor 3 [Sulfidibacter corallicola]|uniref:Peptide chain release factor 3 n=1 Tax=Sulfidibacter corallicola TaxID=2818388 RepID=A0A8A4TT33_SULCO|nr:peptide chain release factor 3 [Sulfidibacter corallicola]QTD52653.1 peptide chain release factor 3 [Sulfidibacter corallicola]